MNEPNWRPYNVGGMETVGRKTLIYIIDQNPLKFRVTVHTVMQMRACPYVRKVSQRFPVPRASVRNDKCASLIRGVLL